MRAALTISLFAASFASSLHASSLDDVLGRMDKAGATFKGLAANISYTKHTALVNMDSTSVGTIKIKRPRPHEMKMLVDYTSPDRKTVWFEEHTVDIYLPNMKVVQEYDVGKNKDLLEQFFLVGFGTSKRDLSEAYTISYGGPEAINGEPATRIVLVSKNPEVNKKLSKFELWISDKTGEPVQQKFYEPAPGGGVGDYNVFIYSNMKINPDLPDSALKPQLPKNVKKEYPNK